MERETLLRIVGDLGEVRVIKPLTPACEIDLDDLYAILLRVYQLQVDQEKNE